MTPFPQCLFQSFLARLRDFTRQTSAHFYFKLTKQYPFSITIFLKTSFWCSGQPPPLQTKSASASLSQTINYRKLEDPTERRGRMVDRSSSELAWLHISLSFESSVRYDIRRKRRCWQRLLANADLGLFRCLIASWLESDLQGVQTVQTLL